MRARKPKGSVVFNRLRATWNFLWCDGKKRRSTKLGTLAELPTRADALRKAEAVRRDLRLQRERAIPTVGQLVEQYRTEKMPRRHSTREEYESWLRAYILPKWRDCLITSLQTRPVELWLESLPLAPKSRVHIRGILSALWNYAMWKQDIPMQVNPMSLVTLEGASKRVRNRRVLTVEQFQLLVAHLSEPFNTLALMCVCFGLRISEALALRWADVNWLAWTLRVERGILQQVVDDVKTDDSRKIVRYFQRSLGRSQEVEDDDSILRAGGLDFRFALPDWPVAIFLHRNESRRYNGPPMLRVWASDDPYVPAFVSLLAGFDWCAGWSAAEANAPFDHQNDDGCLWGCDDRGHAPSPR